MKKPDYIAINLDSMIFIATGDYRQLASYVLVNFPGSRTVISPIDYEKTYRDMSAEELQKLYWNATGQNPTVDRWKLIDLCKELGTKIKVCSDTVESLEARAIETEKQLGIYVPDNEKPGKQQHTRVNSPSQPAVKPKGGTTARVWEIAEELYQVIPDGDGVITNWKEMRASIIEACVAEGINPATAGVQYSKWKSTKN